MSSETADSTAQSSLGARTKRALSWRMASGYLRILLQFGTTAVLARILSRADFGLVAEAQIIINFASVISEIGMAPAIVQKRDLTPTHIHVGIAISFLSGLLLTFGLIAISPWFGIKFYGQPEVVPVMRALAWTFFFSSLSTVGGALLQRKLDFRSLFFMDALSQAAYGVVGIVLALRGWGVWSLVWASLLQAALKAFMAFLLSRHSVSFSFSRQEARELLRFGAGMSATRLVLQFARSADNLVVGRYLGPEMMGLYTRAYSSMTMPVLEFAGALNAVLFPAYSEIQDDKERLRRVYFQNLNLATIRLFPGFVVMAILAPEIMGGVYGEKWVPAAAPLRILCIGGFFLCVHNLGDSLARAKGANAARFWRHLLYAVGVFAGARIGVNYGMEGVAGGVSASLCLQNLLMAQLANSLIGGTWKDFFGAQAPGALLAAVTGAATWAFAVILHTVHLRSLFYSQEQADLAFAFIAGSFGIGVSLVALMLLPRPWLPTMLLPRLDKMRAKVGLGAPKAVSG